MSVDDPQLWERMTIAQWVQCAALLRSIRLRSGRGAMNGRLERAYKVLCDGQPHEPNGVTIRETTEDEAERIARWLPDARQDLAQGLRDALPAAFARIMGKQ